MAENNERRSRRLINQIRNYNEENVLGIEFLNFANFWYIFGPILYESKYSMTQKSCLIDNLKVYKNYH